LQISHNVLLYDGMDLMVKIPCHFCVARHTNN